MTIDWQAVMTSVLTTVGSSVVLVGAAAWLIKTVITERLARDAEEFKSRLKAEADTQIEKLKNSLQMAALEHQVRFSKLHERRAEVIAEVYKRLGEIYAEGRLVVYTMSRSGKLPEYFEQYNAAYKNNWVLARFIEDHRIFLPVRACDLLDKYVRTLNEAVIDTQVYGSVDNPTLLQEKHEALRNALRTIEQDAPKIKQLLEQEFRALLGGTPDDSLDNPRTLAQASE
jgi:hypothetical protein